MKKHSCEAKKEDRSDPILCHNQSVDAWHHMSELGQMLQTRRSWIHVVLSTTWLESCPVLAKTIKWHTGLLIRAKAWAARVEVGMATWKAIRAPSQSKDQNIQICMEKAFKAEWLHSNIFGKGETAITRHLLPPLYLSNFSNDWRGCCPPAPSPGLTLTLGTTLIRSQAGGRSTTIKTQRNNARLF
jgi:hypothetical protein